MCDNYCRCSPRVFRVSRDACIAPALLFFADTRDYLQSNGEHARGKSMESNHTTMLSLHLAHFKNFQSSVFTIVDKNVSDTVLRESCIDKWQLVFVSTTPLNSITSLPVSYSLITMCTKLNQMQVLRRGENRSIRGKTSQSREENQQTQPTYDG